MDLNVIVQGLVSSYPKIALVLGTLGTLVIIGQAYVLMTPNKDDDAWFAKLESIPLLGQFVVIVRNFAPVQRKEPPK